ncbi:MAG: AsmA-like C-terminal region-containing protein [Balneolaceae bacterium]|nr:AsmA-like C-terminal region-containing protein [Balneolaceae bacterium]
MKTFLKILAAVLIVIVLLAVGLNLYFTDDRLKATVMPYVNDAVGREVEVESMSLTLFSTFPQPGLSIRNLYIPGGESGSADTLLSLNEFIVGIELFPLLSNEISVSEIRIVNPNFTYRVFEDGTTNLDFLLQADEEGPAEEPPAEASEGYSVNVPYFAISGGRFGYEDRASATAVTLDGLDADISLNYAERINSTIEIEVGGLSYRSGGTSYLNGLAVSLSETSTIDMENEVVNLESGTFSIRGLALDLTGTVTGWSGAAPEIDLQFSSSSDNFGELLRLAPPEYDEQLTGLETRGALSISGSVSGPVGGETIPSFNATVTVANGYLKNPDLPQPVEEIQIRLKAGNRLVTVESFEARAGANFLTANGKLEQPLEADGPFSLDLQGDLDLSTVENFYSLAEFDVERLAGKLNVSAKASGRLDRPEEATFDADLFLSDGLLKYAEVSKPVENINIEARANQNRVTIRSLNLDASGNRLSVEGRIDRPLSEQERTVDLTADLSFDLATIGDFYPIDEDTLKLGGQLTARAVLQGNAAEIGQAVRSGTLNLENGFIDYQRFGKPIENLTLRSGLKGNRLSITTASFRSGQNDLSLSGTITDYLGDNPVIDLRIRGNARFAEIRNYYDIEPAVTSLTGSGKLDLRASGPIRNPERMAFNGGLTITGLSMEGEALVQPVADLNGELKLTPDAADLTGLGFRLGSSDLTLSGKLTNYMEFLKPEGETEATPSLTGRFRSKLFNVDELMVPDEDAPADEPVSVDLPDLNSSVTAGIGTLIVTGVSMNNLKAEASTSPTQIRLNKASIEMFDGTASGSFTWNVPRPDRTNLRFDGAVDGLNVTTFFREYPVLGPDSEFHEHVTGSFSARVDYYSELDEYLSPDIPTTRMNGTFTLTNSRVRGHPLQNSLAALLKADELRDITLDDSENRFSVRNSVMTIENLKLTSGDIGAEMSGTQHLISGAINYELNVYLPGRYRDRIASVISSQAVDALTQDNGTILLPLRVRGTQEKPRLQPNQDVIKPIIRDMLKKKAGDAIRSLFGDG